MPRRPKSSSQNPKSAASDAEISAEFFLLQNFGVNLVVCQS